MKIVEKTDFIIRSKEVKGRNYSITLRLQRSNQLNDHISIHISYVEWLTSPRLVLINMKGVDRARFEDELKLQVVNTDQ